MVLHIASIACYLGSVAAALAATAVMSTIGCGAAFTPP